jgi:hypothetical protein
MTMKKESIDPNETINLWKERSIPIPIRKYVQEAGVSEKMIVFSETGAGKTRFYLELLEVLKKRGLKKEDLKMYIIFPDRPGGLAKLFGLIPEEFVDCISVLPISNYEDTIIATATAEEGLIEHYKKTGIHGWMIFELLENYWTFSQDFYSRKAYGETLAEYFAHMQESLKKSSGKNSSAYEALSGPFGGPWPIIKTIHNFNWLDKLKRMPYNIIFTSELKEEENKESIFGALGYRPAGEKHTQHKVDTVLYLSHQGNKFFMRPFKLTGYEKLYGQIEITDKCGYEEHLNALKELEKRGYRISPMKDLEKEAGITPPKIPKKKDKKEEPVVEEKSETISIDDSGETVEELDVKKMVKENKEAKQEKDEWSI